MRSDPKVLPQLSSPATHTSRRRTVFNNSSEYGKYKVVDSRHEQDVDDYIVESISEPYSVPLACGDMAAAFEILFGCDLGTSYNQIGPDLYELTGFYDIVGMGTKGMREQLALRGLGNILELKSNEKGLHIHIENAFMHLIVIGLVQGLYEYAFDMDTHLEWELSEEGELRVDVTPLDFNIEKRATA